MVFATFNIVLVIYRTCAIGRGFKMLMFIDIFNNVSVFYHTCAVVGAFRRFMCFATFDIHSYTTPLL
jgi:hypothetical protein